MASESHLMSSCQSERNLFCLINLGLTGNNSIRVVIPKKKEDERKFGDVRGLTGGMVTSLLRGYKRLGRLAPEDRIADVTALWLHWGQIIDYVENNSTVDQSFCRLLSKFGEELLDIFEWKILTAYAHIIVCHTIPLIQKWGNLAHYSQQGLEAANKIHKQIAKRGTNHSKSKSIVQQFYHVYRRIFYSEDIIKQI